jgi:hypothetical protein
MTSIFDGTGRRKRLNPSIERWSACQGLRHSGAERIPDSGTGNPLVFGRRDRECEESFADGKVISMT